MSPPIIYADLQSQKVTLTDVMLSDNKKTVLENLISNSIAIAASHNELTQAAEDRFNDLKTLLDNAQLADGVDIDALAQQINDVNTFLTEAGAGANLLSAVGQLFTVVNTREQTVSFETTVSTVTGIVDLDLTSFGFESINDYQIQVSSYGKIPVTITSDKITPVLARAYVLDHENWEFNDEAIRYKNCSINNVVISVTVVRNPIPIGTLLTETDGDVTQLGIDAIAPDVPVISGLAFLSTTGTMEMTVNGEAEPGSTLTVTYPGGEIVSAVVPVGGLYAVTSTNDVLVSGDVTVVATDAAGNESLPATQTYTV